MHASNCTAVYGRYGLTAYNMHHKLHSIHGARFTYVALPRKGLLTVFQCLHTSLAPLLWTVRKQSIYKMASPSANPSTGLNPLSIWTAHQPEPCLTINAQVIRTGRVSIPCTSISMTHPSHQNRNNQGRSCSVHLWALKDSAPVQQVHQVQHGSRVSTQTSPSSGSERAQVESARESEGAKARARKRESESERAKVGKERKRERENKVLHSSRYLLQPNNMPKSTQH